MSETQVDLIIDNGIVLTMNPNQGQITAGAVAVKNDRITAVGPAADLKGFTASKRIDARGGIIMPGLINTHTHAAMTLFRGLADDLPLMTWLNEHIFPAEAKLDDDTVYWGALLGCAEMIRSGTTCFCDMYLFEQAVARAAKNAGMRAVVGEVLFDFPSPNYGPIEKGFEYTENLIARWQDDDLIVPAVEPHSPYLCAPQLLEKAAGIAMDRKIPLVIHVSETKTEVQQIREKYSRTPMGHLAHLGILSPRLVACHCVVLSDDDMALMAQHDVKVAHNPESNMKLASGIAPVPQLTKQGICVGLGTDGCASNNNLDLFAEMDTAAKLHKVNTLDPTVADAASVLKMSTIDAARALGLDHLTGSLETGKKADIIVIDTHKPHLTPMYNPVSHLVYAVNGSDVAATIINGQVVMEDGRLSTLNQNEIFAKIREITAKIR